MNTIIIDPNPLILSRTGRVHNRGTIGIRNKGYQKCLFNILFDPEIFCRISPAAGEILPNSSKDLQFYFEDTTKGDEELSFLIRYTFVPNVSEDSPNVPNPNDFKSSIKATIRFSSHAEDALKSISSSLKVKPSLNKAISHVEQRDILSEQREMYERKISSKNEQQQQLLQRIEILERNISHQKDEISELSKKPDTQNQLITVSLIVFFMSLLIRWLKK